MLTLGWVFTESQAKLDARIASIASVCVCVCVRVRLSVSLCENVCACHFVSLTFLFASLTFLGVCVAVCYLQMFGRIYASESLCVREFVCVCSFVCMRPPVFVRVCVHVWISVCVSEIVCECL